MREEIADQQLLKEIAQPNVKIVAHMCRDNGNTWIDIFTGVYLSHKSTDVVACYTLLRIAFLRKHGKKEYSSPFSVYRATGKSDADWLNILDRGI